MRFEDAYDMEKFCTSPHIILLLLCLSAITAVCTKKDGIASTGKLSQESRMLVDTIFVGDNGQQVSEYYGFYRVEAARTDSNYRAEVYKRAPVWVGLAVPIKEYRIESDTRSVFSNDIYASLPLSWEHTKVAFKPFSRKYPEQIRQFWVFDEKGGTEIDSVEWHSNGLIKLPDDWYTLQISDNMTGQWRGWLVELVSLEADMPLYEDVTRPFDPSRYTKSGYTFTFLQLPKMDKVTLNDLVRYERRFIEVRERVMEVRY